MSPSANKARTARSVPGCHTGAAAQFPPRGLDRRTSQVWSHLVSQPRTRMCSCSSLSSLTLTLSVFLAGGGAYGGADCVSSCQEWGERQLLPPQGITVPHYCRFQYSDNSVWWMSLYLTIAESSAVITPDGGCHCTSVLQSPVQ